MRRLCIDYFLIIITWTWGFFSQNLQFDFPQQLSTKEYFFSGGGSVVTTSSRDFKYFPYLRLWMDYRHQVWAVGTPLVDDIIELPYTGAGDVLATWSCSSDSSLYIQLWLGYGHQIRTVGTPLGEESDNYREFAQNSRGISSRDLTSRAFLFLFYLLTGLAWIRERVLLICFLRKIFDSDVN